MHTEHSHTTGKLTIPENDLHENLEYFFRYLVMMAIKFFFRSFEALYILKCTQLITMQSHLRNDHCLLFHLSKTGNTKC